MPYPSRSEIGPEVSTNRSVIASSAFCTSILGSAIHKKTLIGPRGESTAECATFSQENDGELHYLLEFDPSSTEVNRSSAVSWA